MSSHLGNDEKGMGASLLGRGGSLALVLALCCLCLGCGADPWGRPDRNDGSPPGLKSLLAAAALQPTQLDVLHTNDNWGETAPCG